MNRRSSIRPRPIPSARAWVPGSRGTFCIGIGRGGYVEDGCGHSIVLGGYSRSEVLSDIVISGGHATATRCGSSVRASPAGR
ncbi:hypothetical protein J5W60_10505 [Akkermansia muciniphila]|uniref:hypothetical protein n=1 Tax=Akkermansia muciniphila TaxID=239935 RepID=UPI001C061E4F|nr:hypothetical protein [Akkermansia muciniphila]QWP31320.1 hypothetical protein J5W60_10505 [Akkermansia muciniphila]